MKKRPWLPQGTLPKAKDFNDILTMDLKELAQEHKTRYKCILNMVDKFSKYTQAVLIRDKEADTIFPWGDSQEQEDNPGYPDLLDNDMVINNTQPELESLQAQDPVTNTGETLDIPDVHSDPELRQQITHQEDPQEQCSVVNSSETLGIPDVYSNTEQRQQLSHQEDSGFKEPSQGEYRQSPQAQQHHLGSNPEVKMTPAITLTDEVHDKKVMGRPTKVKGLICRQPRKQRYTRLRPPPWIRPWLVLMVVAANASVLLVLMLLLMVVAANASVLLVLLFSLSVILSFLLL